MNRRSILGLVAMLTAGAAIAGDLPDARMTPGALNPDVTQATIHETICVKGWTKTIRPPVYYTNTLKKQQILVYGYADVNPKHYEEDHLVPLELGGHPTDVRNLWPQPWNSEWDAGKKDQLENALHRAVCEGEVPLAQAQRAFMGGWIDAYKRYAYLIGKHSSRHYFD